MFCFKTCKTFCSQCAVGHSISSKSPRLIPQRLLGSTLPVSVCVCVSNTIRLSRHVKIIHKSQTIWTNSTDRAWNFLCRAWMSLMTMTEKRRRGRWRKVLHSRTRSRTRRWPLTPERPTRYRWECVFVLVMSEDNSASRGCLECRHRSALQRQCWPKKRTQSSDKTESRTADAHGASSHIMRQDKISWH